MSQLEPRMTDAEIEAIAQRVAELIRPGGGAALVDVPELCRLFSLSRTWVYENANQLGAIRLGPSGPGRRPRLRFDVERARVAIERLHPGTAPAPSQPAPPRRRAPDSAPVDDRVPPGVPLLEPRGRRPV